MMKYSRLKNRYGPGGNDGLVSGIEYAVRLTSSIFMGRLLSCLALADYAAAHGNNRGCKIGSDCRVAMDVASVSHRPTRRCHSGMRLRSAIADLRRRPGILLPAVVMDSGLARFTRAPE